MPIQLSGGNELVDAIHLLEQGGVHNGMKVAALGCGSSGHFVFPAAHLVGPTGAVFAVDILKTALSAIKSRAKLQGVSNVQAVWADLEKVGSVDILAQSIDVVLYCSTLFQIHDKVSALKEAKRLLKPGGALVVAEWKTGGTAFGPAHALRIHKDKLTQIIEGEGFEKQNEFEAGPYHYGIVFRNK